MTEVKMKLAFSIVYHSAGWLPDALASSLLWVSCPVAMLPLAPLPEVCRTRSPSQPHFPSCQQFWSRKEQGTRLKLMAEMRFEDHLWFSLVLPLVNRLHPELKAVVFLLFSWMCCVFRPWQKFWLAIYALPVSGTYEKLNILKNCSLVGKTNDVTISI